PEMEHHYVRTFKQRLERLDGAALDAAFRALEAEGGAALLSEGVARTEHRFERLLDLRYSGANSELTLAMGSDADAGSLRERFAILHQRQFGYRSDSEAVETMNVRVIARVSGNQPHVPERPELRDRSGARPEPRSV